jgi:hypothetical protein
MFAIVEITFSATIGIIPAFPHYEGRIVGASAVLAGIMLAICAARFSEFLLFDLVQFLTQKQRCSLSAS